MAAVLSTAWAESVVNDDSRLAPMVFEIDGPHRVSPKSVEVLDRKILGLHNGMPVSAVRSKLGGETTGVLVDSSLTLFYGPWSLVFSKNGLISRSRELERSPKIEKKNLDKRIFGLELGMSVGVVRSVLGRPNVLRVQATEFGQEVSLTYGKWMLSFTGGRLDSRNRLW